MTSYPVEIRRCQHVKVNGTQCGSPALREKKFCFFHQQWREKRVKLNSGASRRVASIVLPVLEDANSIQVAVMRVTRLLLSGQIEQKTASLTLYALQIASSNLARISFEASRPTKVVVDREKVAETPLGATPWAASGKGYEPEDDEEAAYVTDDRSLMEKFGLDDMDEDEENRDADGLPPGTIQASRSRWVV
jgi:hypothetical protein